jgi:hypothetical protein
MPGRKSLNARAVRAYWALRAAEDRRDAIGLVGDGWCAQPRGRAYWDAEDDVARWRAEYDRLDRECTGLALACLFGGKPYHIGSDYDREEA